MKRKTVFLGMLAILLASVLNGQAQTNQVKTECMQLQDARTDVAGNCNSGTPGWYNVIEYSTNGGGSWTLLPADYDNNPAGQPAGATANDCEFGAGITAVTVAISSGATSTNSTSLTGSVSFSTVGCSGASGYEYRVTTTQAGLTSISTWIDTGLSSGDKTLATGVFTTIPVSYPQPATTGLAAGTRVDMFVEVRTKNAPVYSLVGSDISGAENGCGGTAGNAGGICLWKAPLRTITISSLTHNGDFCNNSPGCTVAQRIANADALCPSGYRALISFDTNNEIVDVLTNINYKNSNDLDLANNLADFLDGSLQNKISTTSMNVWTFTSSANLTLGDRTCLNGTSNSALEQGRYGDPSDNRGTPWLFGLASISCNNLYPIYCITF